jgi:para-aminobenzoate synthetase component 1
MVTQGVELAMPPAELLTRCADQPYVFALDGASGASWGRGSAVLGFRPRATLRIERNGDALVRGADTQRWHGDPFALLDRFRTAYAPPADADGAAVAGGLVVALSYNLRHWVERLPRRAGPDLGLPVVHAAFYDWLLSYSYAEHRYQLSSWSGSQDELRRVGAEIQARAALPAASRPGARQAQVRCDVGRRQYVKAVEAALDYIAAGDVYQVNLAQRFTVHDPPPPPTLFAALQRQHAVPFGAYVDGGDFVLVSNSPECFLTLQGPTIATFPIKGTRRRGAETADDERLARQLARDPKEQAEHLMIVDLERNDLGRVCRTGSVQVAALAQVHSFPSLHHLVSKVTGELHPGTPLANVLRATFPGGSITGAPKIRAMQIIDELEPVGRDFYTGAIGFVGLNGDAVFSLAIRTAVAAREQLTYHAGGGIVADSAPVAEYEETLLKAQPFFAALNTPTV